MQDACRYFLIESGIALFIAFLINVAVVSVSGTVCTVGNVTQTTADQCSDITLNSASFLLQVYSYYYKERTVLICIINIIYIEINVEYIDSECIGKIKLHYLRHSVICIGTKLQHHRHLCRSVHHAGIVLYLIINILYLLTTTIIMNANFG